MTKTYKLLKDIFEANAGTLFVQDGESYYQYEDIHGRKMTTRFEGVENNPSWFKEVTPEENILPVKFSKEISDFIETSFNHVEEDWHYTHLWYKKIGENLYELYSFDKLPKGFQRTIMNHNLESPI